MENLRFSAAYIPSYADIKDALREKKGLTIPFHECVWCVDNLSQEHCYYFCQKSNDYGTPVPSQAYEIYPTLGLANLADSGFHVGDTFNIKGITFFIYNEFEAIATQSIGSFAWENDEYGVISRPTRGDYFYNCSTLRNIVQDWFDYFIKTESIAPKKSFSSNILKYYDIEPMPGHPGRYHIVNKNGKMRHNASGHGFTSPKKAKNMLVYYASTVPVPQEDIDAYEAFNEKLIDDAFADSLPF